MGIILRSIVLGTALTTLAAACGSNGGDDGGADGKLRVVAAVYPLEEAAVRVGGDRVSVETLTPPGVEPHDLELTPGDLETISQADLILYVGGGFQPAVEDAIAAAATGATVDVLAAAGERTPLLEDPQGELTSDPHIWLSPQRYLDVVAEVEEALSSVDPSNADGYRGRAETWEATLRRLADDFDVLATCDRDLLVTGHEAFGYLAADHGLRQVGISGVSPEAEPGPARLAEIRQLVEDEGVTTVFAEELLPSDSAETIAAVTGAQVAMLNTIETRTEAQREAGIGYEELMRQNLAALKEGLGCG
jgi:zinc transport system substrate-binding protein